MLLLRLGPDTFLVLGGGGFNEDILLDGTESAFGDILVNGDSSSVSAR